MPAKRSVKKDEEEFQRKDCDDAEFNDTGDKKKRNKAQKNAKDATQLISTEFLPASMKKLRACL